MIHHLRGTLDRKFLERVIIDAAGVGYEVFVPLSTGEKLPAMGKEVKLYIMESTAMYGGSTTLYGFMTEEERDVFDLLREAPGTGAKKALDYLDKVSKSLPDFKRCIMQKDISALVGVFGFTKKTAEKLAAALKDKIDGVTLAGKEKWTRETAVPTATAEAISGLISLGYKESLAREAVEKAAGDEGDKLAVQEIIRRSLKYLAG